MSREENVVVPTTVQLHVLESTQASLKKGPLYTSVSLPWSLREWQVLQSSELLTNLLNLRCLAYGAWLEKQNISDNAVSEKYSKLATRATGNTTRVTNYFELGASPTRCTWLYRFADH